MNFFVHEATINSTTLVLDLRREHAPYLPRMISGWDMLPIPTRELLVLETTNKLTTTVLEDIIQDGQ